MKSSPALVGLLALALFTLGGCHLPPARQYEASAPVYLMLVVPAGMVPESLSVRREQVITYLLESGLIDSRDDLVNDPAVADHIIRAVLSADGFTLSFFGSGTARGEVYEPLYLPSDYWYYEDLIFYGTPGTRYPHRRDDDHRKHEPAPRPPQSNQPGDDHRPHVPTPRSAQDDDDHRKHEPGPYPAPPDRPGDDHRQPGHPDKPRNGEPADQPRFQPRPEQPPPRTNQPSIHPEPDRQPPAERPHHDDRPAPRNDDKPRKDDDKPKPEQPPVRNDNGVVPAR